MFDPFTPSQDCKARSLASVPKRHCLLWGGTLAQRSAATIVAAALLVWLLVWLRASEALSAPEADSRVATPSTAFKVYDALLFRNKPDLSKFGMLPARGSGNYWSATSPRGEVDEWAVRNEISRNRDFSGLFYVDIEDWKVYGVPDAEIDASIAKLGRVADIVRETAPNLRFGFYALMPEDAMVAGTPEQLQRWRDSARRTEGLARKVDVILPSLYTFEDSKADRGYWLDAARITLTEARRYHKPVYAFLWPEFHQSSEKQRGRLVPGDYWRMELDAVRRYADGVVLWGGDQRSWDENAAWWQETKAFLAALSEARPRSPGEPAPSGR